MFPMAWCWESDFVQLKVPPVAYIIDKGRVLLGGVWIWVLELVCLGCVVVWEKNVQEMVCGKVNDSYL